MSRLGVSGAAFVLLLFFSPLGADDELFDRSECKKTGFEKRLYYSLERLDGLSSAQKDAINRALREFQTKRERVFAANVKKFQSDDIKKEQIKAIISEPSDSSAELLGAIHKHLSQKQREQFIKKFQGMID